MNQSCDRPRFRIGRFQLSRCTVSYLLIAAFLAIPLLIALSSMAAAAPADDADPATQPPVESVPAPSFVMTWLATEGLSAITTSEGSDLSPENLAAVVPGSAVPVWEWSPDYLRGDPNAEAIHQDGVWAAPLLLNGAPVGAIVMETRGSAVSAHSEEWDTSVGTALQDLGAAFIVMERNPRVWFLLTDGSVAPVNDAARELLAGSLPLETFQPFLVDRLGNGDGTSADTTTPTDPVLTPTLVVAGVMLLILGLTAVVVWLRRPTEVSA